MSSPKPVISINMDMDTERVAKALAEITAKLSRFTQEVEQRRVYPAYGTEMRGPDGEVGMALGEGTTFCLNHLCIQTHGFWEPADTTK